MTHQCKFSHPPISREKKKDHGSLKHLFTCPRCPPKALKFKSRVYVKKSWKPIDDHGHRVVIILDYPSDIGAK